MQFSNAGGTYNIAGAATLNGGDAGIDIFAGSSGTFTFANTTITDPTGIGLNVGGSSADVNFNGGGINQNNAVTAVQIVQNTGTVDINVEVTANTSTATGIFLDNNGTGTINFDGGLDIDTTTGTGFIAQTSGTVNVTNVRR